VSKAASAFETCVEPGCDAPRYRGCRHCQKHHMRDYRNRQGRVSEHDQQVALFEFVARFGVRLPELRLLFAIPNGGARHPVVAVKLKAEGVRRGVPDIFLPIPRNGSHGLFLELKNGTKGRVSSEQREWLADLDTQGYATAVARDWTAAARLILVYLGARPDDYGL
jgi:hypothetical protein